MSEQVQHFYDALAEHYHLIFEDWDRSMQRQARTLDALLSARLPAGSLRILDCACGIGTQALGLAALGHRLVASDLSPAEVARARREAHARGLAIEFHVSDMTSLAEIVDTHFKDSQFDVVAALDNALPHLNAGQLVQAVQAMAGRLRCGGLFVASIRDYDTLVLERPTMLEPAFYGDEGQRRIVHQVWDWAEAEYTLHLYITQQCGPTWETHHFVSHYRCLQRAELTQTLAASGFADIAWLMPAESGYYQPLVVARRP